MPEFVHWLLVNPVRWLIPATMLSCVVGIPLMFWWEGRRPRRRPDGLAAWREMTTEAQRGRDNAVLGASESATVTAARMAEAAKRNALFHP